MKLFHEVGASSLGLPAETFIYNIVHLPSNSSGGEQTFVTSSSNDALTLFAVTQSSSHCVIKVLSSLDNCHKGLSCLQIARLNSVGASTSGRSIMTAGRDGLVKIWALNTQGEFSATHLLRAPNDAKHQGISALAQSQSHSLIAAGTELENDGPGDVTVYIWKVQDVADPQLPVLAFKESHTDTITNLSFQPPVITTGSSGHEIVHLVSSSTDGLVNVFDLEQQDEDDAVLAVVNTRSAVQYMACVGGTGQVWTISQDENLASNSLVDVDIADGSQQPNPQEPIDLRQTLNCDYAISLKTLRHHGTDAVLAVGGYKSDTAMEPRVDLYSVSESSNALSISEPETRLVGGHGEEIVRDIWYSEDISLIVTCGEDTHIRVWLEANASPAESKAAGGRRRMMPKRVPDARFRPYSIADPD